MTDQEIADKIRQCVAELNGYVELATSAGLEVNIMPNCNIDGLPKQIYLEVESIRKVTDL